MKSIIEDQIAEAESMGIPAASAVDISEDEFRAAILKFNHRFRWYANTRGNVSKLSISLACYRQIGSKSTSHSPLAWRKEGQKVTIVAVIGGFRSDLSITPKTDGRFETFPRVFCFPKSRINEVVKTTCNVYSNRSDFRVLAFQPHITFLEFLRETWRSHQTFTCIIICLLWFWIFTSGVRWLVDIWQLTR